MKGLKREGLGWRIGRDVVIALGLILILAPLYVVIVNTFKDLEEASKGFFSLPQSLNFQNYEELFSKNNFWNYVKNSAYITVISIILVIIINPAVSYAIARNFRRRYYKAVYFYIILGLFIPFQVIMLPVTKIMTNMNLLNPNGLILLYAALSLSKGVFMFVNYIQSLPYEVEEAARIDGCNTFQVYTKIVLHLIGPMLATLIVPAPPDDPEQVPGLLDAPAVPVQFQVGVFFQLHDGVHRLLHVHVPGADCLRARTEIHHLRFDSWSGEELK